MVGEGAAEAGALSRGEQPREATDYGSALVGRARLGDVDAFDELYRVHRDRVYTLCVDLCGDRELAQDLLQETFVRAWRGLRGFGGRSSFATWVHRIAVNVCRDAARRRGGRVEDSSGRGAGASSLRLSSGQACRTDMAVVEQVRAALAGLKPAFRVALALRYTVGLSYEEIGETLGWSLPKVKVTIHRAKRAFREAYVGGDEG